MALTSTDAPSESVKPKTVRAAAVVAEAEAEVVAATTAEAVVAATVAMIVAAVEVVVIAVAVAAMSATGAVAVAVAAEAVATTAGVVAESAIAAFDLSKRNVFSLPGENMQLNLGSLFGVSSLFANPAKGVTFAQSMRSRSAPFT